MWRALDRSLCDTCRDAMSELKELLLGGETALSEPMDVRLD